VTRTDTSGSSRIVLRTPDAGPRRPDGVPTGQHAAWHPVPWHQRVLVALIAAGLLAGLVVAGVRTWDAAPVCAPVRIVAAPEVAPLVAQVATRLDHAAGCAFSVIPRASADEAQALVGGPDLPHVWMPESTLQLAQARARGATTVPPAGVSVVATPVVMALAADAVGKLGPGRPTCDEVLRDDDIVVGAPDPTQDPVGLAALLEAQADLGSGPDGDATLVAFLRKQNLIPDLKGRHVLLSGFGYTAPPQPVLNEAQRDSIISQWEAIVQAGGGCASVDPTGNTAAAVPGLPAVAVAKPPPPVVFSNCGTIVLSDAGSVGFVRGKATFRDPSSAQATLRQLGSKLKQGSEHITIIGSTSSEGGDTVNDPLSRQRAGAVAGILTSMGIPSSRMTTVGDGSHWPGRVNDTGPGGVLLPAQAEQNRVVVVQLPRCA